MATLSNGFGQLLEPGFQQAWLSVMQSQVAELNSQVQVHKKPKLSSEDV